MLGARRSWIGGAMHSRLGLFLGLLALGMANAGLRGFQGGKEDFKGSKSNKVTVDSETDLDVSLDQVIEKQSNEDEDTESHTEAEPEDEGNVTQVRAERLIQEPNQDDEMEDVNGNHGIRVDNSDVMEDYDFEGVSGISDYSFHSALDGPIDAAEDPLGMKPDDVDDDTWIAEESAVDDDTWIAEASCKTAIRKALDDNAGNVYLSSLEACKNFVTIDGEPIEEYFARAAVAKFKTIAKSLTEEKNSHKINNWPYWGLIQLVIAYKDILEIDPIRETFGKFYTGQYETDDCEQKLQIATHEAIKDFQTDFSIAKSAVSLLKDSDGKAEVSKILARHDRARFCASEHLHIGEGQIFLHILNMAGADARRLCKTTRMYEQLKKRKWLQMLNGLKKGNQEVFGWFRAFNDPNTQRNILKKSLKRLQPFGVYEINQESNLVARDIEIAKVMPEITNHISDLKQSLEDGDHDHSFENAAFLVTGHTLTIKRSVTEVPSWYDIFRPAIKEITFDKDSMLSEINDIFSPAITKIMIPKSVTRIREYAFRHANIKTVTFAEDSLLSEIGARLFADSSITSITVPKSVTRIRAKAFKNATSLNTVTFAEDSLLSEIESYGFAESRITSITVPKSVTRIRAETFVRANSLKTVTFAEDSLLSKIESFGFAGSSITSITVPKSVTEIPGKAFAGANIKTVTFAEDSLLREIESNAFDETGITSITVPKSVTEIRERAFSGANRLKTVTFAEDSLLSEFAYLGFAESSITSITVPKSLTRIPGCAFLGANSLKTVTFAEDSLLREFDKYGFAGSGITSITVPKSVTRIRAHAFDGANRLKTVTFAEDSLLSKIESSAFNGTGITSITVPKSVTEIRARAFSGANSLKTVILAENSLLGAHVLREVFGSNSNVQIIVGSPSTRQFS